MRNSFQTRVAAVLIMLLMAVIGALYLAVQAATSVAVRNQAREQLDVGTRVFEQLLEVRGRQLHDAAQVLASDFGFKDAVASGDAATIRSALANQGARINAGIMLLFNLDGRVEVSTKAEVAGMLAERLNTQMVRLQNEGAQVFLLPIHDQVYLLVQATVAAPLPLARLVLGVPIDQAFARELQQLTHLDLTLLGFQSELPDIWVSTLDSGERELMMREAAQEMIAADARVNLHGESYLVQRLVLSQGTDFQVLALLHRSLTRAEAAFAPLGQHILLISLAALMASLIGALLLARSISQPVRQLARMAERVGQGDYDGHINLQRGDELGSLANAFVAMQSGLAERERQLAHNALHDPLTGLANRNLALERLGSAITAERPMALLYIGIGNLRVISESCGPGGADLAIQQMTRRLQSVLRPGDSIARIIADEFLLLLENTDSDNAVAIADQVQQLLIKPLQIGIADIAMDCSLGIAVYPANGTSADDLLRRASIAMGDAAKLPGRLQLYQRGRDADHDRQVRLIRDLRRAALRGELLLHYQPKLSLSGSVLRQAEALLRWQHPQLGMISPGEFIPLAESTGSIQALTAWVIEEAMRQLREWHDRGLPVQLSLNISTQDLLDPGLPSRVRELLAQYRLAADLLTFEITESGVMLNPTVALGVLHDLRACGISLSVDDFGTGYSSLAQLKRMPVQELKIDQSFIRDLSDTSEDAVIVRSTIEMSHSLGLTVVAEGVELERSLRLLQRWHCDTAQGYFISRPLTASAFEAWAAHPQPSPAATVS
ncbi:MAG: EAL domain-containing protein [Gammaproteobacteria bacterium]|nr:EAL domain-containing protein [Gammaproteobacteria bacterium]MBU1490474.1 EAL domain-containing protein [Gammaproteobacteria bacterium]MBU2140283.1 EAL domain-containing protein [Gammaproteobacteria bacterium]MBU2217162.1 EAL domain-containing protein [Gammaproteobacteria bacterium]MBU2323880.1 EAL domain-containing protein [Gammaproteobacteria bacterium]